MLHRPLLEASWGMAAVVAALLSKRRRKVPPVAPVIVNDCARAGSGVGTGGSAGMVWGVQARAWDAGTGATAGTCESTGTGGSAGTGAGMGRGRDTDTAPDTSNHGAYKRGQGSESRPGHRLNAVGVGGVGTGVDGV
jgi:hypothetical protein